MFVGRSKLFKFYDPCLIPDLPRDDLPGMFAVVRLDDRPTAMITIVTTPFKMMQIACRVELFDDRIAILCLMW